MHNIYQWQSRQWQYLIARKNNHNLPHALLLSGQAGLGKFDFALAFAELLLCRQPVVDGGNFCACGICSSCSLLAANNHPDLLVIAPEDEEKPIIKIDQIRTLIATLSNTAQQGGYQVAVIKFAETMNIAAANALLKTLEEPAAQVVLILVSSQPSFLPATIRSRCQHIVFQPPVAAEAEKWLKNRVNLTADNNIALLLSLTENAPLKSLSLAQNADLLAQREKLLNNLLNITANNNHAHSTIGPIGLAEACLHMDLKQLLNVLMSIVIDIIKIKVAGSRVEDGALITLANKDKIQQLQLLATKLTFSCLYSYFDKLLEYNKYANNNININKQLALEKLFLEWKRQFNS